MVQALILTHGNLAEALLETATRIAGELRGVQCLALDWNEPREVLLERISRVIRELDEGDGVVVMTDLYGDTPSNLALSLVDPGRVEVVTGVNLPMVLRLGCVGSRPGDVGELARWILAKGRQGIRLCAAVPAPVGGDEG